MRGAYAHAMFVALACLTTTLSAVAFDPVDRAADLIGRPYRWGAEGPDAFDCSGLTQYVFADAGIDLPRRAINQADAGFPADGKLRRGDLVFFSTNAGSSHITHVGIYEGDGMMIDASARFGEVRREDLNDSYWRRRFVRARRILSGTTVADRRPPQPSTGKNRSGGRAQVMRRVAEELLRHVMR